jgi:DivIVA domain-containing protein
VRLLLIFAVAAVVGLVGFAIAAFLAGDERGLESFERDSASIDLPANRPVTPADLEAVRFDVVLRGYRMGQVDTVLDRMDAELDRMDAELERMSGEIRARDERIAALTGDPNAGADSATDSVVARDASTEVGSAPAAGAKAGGHDD